MASATVIPLAQYFDSHTVGNPKESNGYRRSKHGNRNPRAHRSLSERPDDHRRSVRADLLTEVLKIIGVEAHGEDRVGTLALRLLDEPVLGFDPAVGQHLGHALQLAADQRLET